MSLLPERYAAIRERLVELFPSISTKTYSFFIKPSSLLSVEQLRERETFTASETIGDSGYFEEYQDRNMTIPMILKILPNFLDTSELGFKNAGRDVPLIYENIQEYIGLWVELMLNEPLVNHPPLEELRALEGFAFFIYSVYRRIKPFVTNQENSEQFKNEAALNKQGLMGLGALMSLNSMGSGAKKQQDGFISSLDGLEASQEALLPPEVNPLFFGGNVGSESMAVVEKAFSDPTWSFRSS